MIRGLPVTTRSLKRRSPAFTLVELLVVISIIALLAGIILTAMAGVQETARVNRTRAQIAQINALLMEKWEEYKTRRVPEFPEVYMKKLGGDSELIYGSMKYPRSAAFLRLLAMRELMRLELPERYTDIKGNRWVFPDGTAIWRAYDRVVPNPVTQRAQFEAVREKNQQAECLYLVLSQMRDGDVSALSFFRDTEIQDTDGDGMLEIVDAWGTPIRWLRWAPGYLSNLQPEPDERIPDPFDPALTDYRSGTVLQPFEMYPLIYSAGPDKIFDIQTEFNKTPPWVDYSQTLPFPNDPYYFYFSTDWKMGQVILAGGDATRDESSDNIDNHSLVAR